MGQHNPFGAKDLWAVAVVTRARGGGAWENHSCCGRRAKARRRLYQTDGQVGHV